MSCVLSRNYTHSLRNYSWIDLLLFSTGDTISYIPGDNPVYGIPENRTNRTNTITLETAEFDNPIYGSRESFNDAELVNPIYGDADFEDVPYELAPAVSDYETPVVGRYRAQGKTIIQDTQLQGIIKLFVYRTH